MNTDQTPDLPLKMFWDQLAVEFPLVFSASAHLIREAELKRLADAMATFMGANDDGSACENLEDLLARQEGPTAAILIRAFQQACCSAELTFLGTPFRASLLLIPLIVRADRPEAFPTMMDMDTAALLQADLHARLDGEGRSADCFVPVSAFFRMHELDRMRPSACHVLLKRTLDFSGIQPFDTSDSSSLCLSSLQEDGDSEVGCDVSSESSPILRDRLPTCMLWTDRSEEDDSIAFMETIESFGKSAQSSLKGWPFPREVRAISGHFLAVVWVSPSGEGPPKVFSDPVWHDRVSSLISKSTSMNEIRESSWFRTSETPTKVFASGRGAENKDLSIAPSLTMNALGLFDPVRAIARVQQELLTIRLIAATHLCMSKTLNLNSLSAENIDDRDDQPSVFILFDPKSEVLSVTFGNASESPVFRIKASHSVWLYPLLDRIASEIEGMSRQSVHVKVIDHMIHVENGRLGFGTIH